MQNKEDIEDLKRFGRKMAIKHLDTKVIGNIFFAVKEALSSHEFQRCDNKKSKN
jgi:hypothetical protein